MTINIKETEQQTYTGWKRAVKKINPEAVFHGDIDIDSSFKWGRYCAEWDGAVGTIIVQEMGDISEESFKAYYGIDIRFDHENVFLAHPRELGRLLEVSPKPHVLMNEGYINFMFLFDILGEDVTVDVSIEYGTINCSFDNIDNVERLTVLTKQIV